MNARAGVLQTLCPHCGTINRIEQARLGQKPNCGRCHKPLFTGTPLAADDAVFSQLVQQAGALPQQQFSAWVLRNLPD